MGENLAALFTSLANMPDEEIRAVHPGQPLAPANFNAL
jgi:hypothetical protein